MSYRIQPAPFVSARRRTRLLAAIGLPLAATMACVGASRAQEPEPGALWSVYFSAGVEATKNNNWPEAEALFAAAAEQAKQHQPAEPYLTFANYSLAVTYYEENRAADSQKIFDSMHPVLDPALVGPDLQQSVDALTAMGNLFYNQAYAANNDPKRKNLTGAALTKYDEDIGEKNLYARRYYQWAFVIDQKLLPPDSPELAGPAESLGLMNFDVGDYAAAIDSLTQLMRIQEMTTQREKTLSSGSVAYSLATRKETGPATNRDAPPAAVAVIIGRSYEVVASAAAKDKPAEAARDLGLAEPYLEKYLDDADFGKTVRIVLLRIYEAHEQLLRQLKDPAGAAALETKAKPLRATQEKPS